MQTYRALSETEPPALYRQYRALVAAREASLMSPVGRNPRTAGRRIEQMNRIMRHLIVSRHPAAVEFIRANAPEFADAPVMESVSADDVRGCAVAGNLPLHLASLAAEVVAVEFAGEPPRGSEYGLAEMQAAGARLARYQVSPSPTPRRRLYVDIGDGRESYGL